MTLDETLAAYNDCTHCAFSSTRRNVVHGRGDVPADILFIGESPDKTDDLLGEAFRGPPGRKLNAMLRVAARSTGINPRVYMTHIICCRPCDDAGGTNREPTDVEAMYCRPHLADVVAHVNPTAVVFLGQIAARYGIAVCPDGITLPHPGFLLRLGAAGDAALRGAMRTLESVFRKVGG